jgi:hypothetical protein
MTCCTTKNSFCRTIEFGQLRKLESDAEQPHSTRIAFGALNKLRQVSQQQHEHLVKRILLQKFFKTPVFVRVKSDYLHAQFV